MTDRPKPVDLTPFEGITLPDDWATAYTYGNGKVLHANIPAWLADLTATRDERDRLRAALDKSIPFVETLISLTPTGVQREHACDFNIMARALLAELEATNDENLCQENG